MPIEIHLGVYHHLGEPDQHEPRIICEICEKQISEYGNVLFPPPQEGKPIFVAYTHKGKCTRYYEMMHGRQYSKELGDFLEHLCNGAGVPSPAATPESFRFE